MSGNNGKWRYVHLRKQSIHGCLESPSVIRFRWVPGEEVVLVSAELVKTEGGMWIAVADHGSAGMECEWIQNHNTKDIVRVEKMIPKDRARFAWNHLLSKESDRLRSYTGEFWE